MKCVYCQGEMRRGTTVFHVDRSGCHLVLDKVAAWVCEQCGEAYFDAKGVDAIQELVKMIEEKAQNLAEVS